MLVQSSSAAGSQAACTAQLPHAAGASGPEGKRTLSLLIHGQTADLHPPQEGGLAKLQDARHAAEHDRALGVVRHVLYEPRGEGQHRGDQPRRECARQTCSASAEKWYLSFRCRISSRPAPMFVELYSCVEVMMSCLSRLELSQPVVPGPTTHPLDRELLCLVLQARGQIAAYLRRRRILRSQLTG
jgi:hypothetical protein